MLTQILLIVTSMLFSSQVVAEVSCGEPPTDVPLNVQHEIKGDVEGEAQLFTKLLGNTQLKGEVQTTKKELYQKYKY